MGFLRSRVFWTNVGAYALAGAIVWYLSRDIPARTMLADLKGANMPLFVGASLFGFAVWFIGETILFSRLFSYIHRPTGFREVMPANAANYFMQLINLAVAGGMFVLFLNRRKGVPWLHAGWTLIFQTMIDAMVLSSMIVISAIVFPNSPIGGWLWYAVGALILFSLIAAFWINGKPISALGQWFLDRDSMEAFRTARPSHYARLLSIRFIIFALSGVALYLQMAAFGIKAGFGNVMAFNPAVILLGGLPITPVGMGPYQAVVVRGFSAFASKSDLLAASLAITGTAIAFRIPMGLFSASLMADEVVHPVAPEAAGTDTAA
ncbi:MAG TPA: lysylphosphatidylglycerol synthase domain-containing protein [Candidatus Binataceae bacterium]|nr:lysylphosphatidylglycerol synthase domain-containing protein [Candidatus Binataceae bacterium]